MKTYLVFLSALLLLTLAVGCGSESPLDADGDGGNGNVFDRDNSFEFNARNVELLSRVDTAALAGEKLNDVWGWTDPQTGVEYALVGMTDKVTFVNLSDPKNPTISGYLPEPVRGNGSAGATSAYRGNSVHVVLDETEKSPWRDLKVYRNHLFVVSDGQPHGLQVFDLGRLREEGDAPVTFTAELHWQAFGNAHNIAINEETGYAYIAGSNRYGGGLLIADIRDPLQPSVAGSHQDTTMGRDRTGYVHDTQCVVYRGPDGRYGGRELCFNASETGLAVADVTEKSSAVTIGKSDYEGRSYAHQGWLTEDHRYFLLDDELDERQAGNPAGEGTTTYIWDMADLEDPRLIGVHRAPTQSIDHNQYVKGGHVYQANYLAGLRILSLEDIDKGELREVARFDAHPGEDYQSFDGAWSVYPFFRSGVVIVSDMTEGLLVLRPEL